MFRLQEKTTKGRKFEMKSENLPSKLGDFAGFLTEGRDEKVSG